MENKSYVRTGLDKSFSNVVVRWATIDPYLVARSKKWLPRNYFSIIKLIYVETYEKRLIENIYRGLGVVYSRRSWLSAGQPYPHN